MAYMKKFKAYKAGTKEMIEVEADYYMVAPALNHSPIMAHSQKKLWDCGERNGGKSYKQDVEEIRNQCNLELERNCGENKAWTVEEGAFDKHEVDWREGGSTVEYNPEEFHPGIDTISGVCEDCDKVMAENSIHTCSPQIKEDSRSIIREEFSRVIEQEIDLRNGISEFDLQKLKNDILDRLFNNKKES